jgi:hypothetical protein
MTKNCYYLIALVTNSAMVLYMVVTDTIVHSPVQSHLSLGLVALPSITLGGAFFLASNTRVGVVSRTEASLEFELMSLLWITSCSSVICTKSSPLKRPIPLQMLLLVPDLILLWPYMANHLWY